MEVQLPEGVEILESIAGHHPTRGKSAGQELNWAYCLRDVNTNEVFVGMFCKPNHITFIDTSTWDKLQTDEFKQITWYYAPVGYVSRTVKASDSYKVAYLHQFIMNHHGNGKGQESIDHINQNKLDNRSSNLRIASQSIQNTNRGKVARHRGAQELPSEITEELPKYCVYYKEFLDKDKNRWREFFTIEGHPNQIGKRKATVKSMKISIMDKLQEAKDILATLDGLTPSPEAPC